MRVVSTQNGLIELASIKERNGKPERVVKLPANKPLHLETPIRRRCIVAQGLTNDRVMISINTKSRTTSLNLFYVAISRARLEARVYTDAIAGLPAAIAKRYDKTTALSLQKEREVMRLQKPHALKTIADGATNERALERKQRVQPATPSEGRERTK